MRGAAAMSGLPGRSSSSLAGARGPAARSAALSGNVAVMTKLRREAITGVDDWRVAATVSDGDAQGAVLMD